MHRALFSKACFPPGGILRAERNFPLLVSSQPELIETRQRKIQLRAQTSAYWKISFSNSDISELIFVVLSSSKE